jgi:hypothetical protein
MLKTAIVTLSVICCALLCSGSMAATYGIALDFTSGSLGYAGSNWDWCSTEGVPAGSVRMVGVYGPSSLTKSPTDTIAIGTPGITSVSASFLAMSSNGMGGVSMDYRLTYSDGSTELRTLGIAPIGGLGNEWKPVAEVFVTAKPLASIELASFTGIAPPFGPTYVYLDAVSITATGDDPPVSEPGGCGISNRAAYHPIISTVGDTVTFKVWGKATILGSDSFTVDDGSGTPVTVVAPGFGGIQDGDYASASGKFFGEVSNRVLNAKAVDVVRLH